MPAYTLVELQARLGGRIHGDGNRRLSGVASLENANEEQLGFLVNAKFLAQAAASRAGALIVSDKIEQALPQDCLAVANPHAAFARAAALLHPEPSFAKGIHPGAFVAEDAVIGPDVRIDAGAVVGAGAHIGARTRVGAQCVIGPGARIGEDCLLHAHSTVQHACVLGDRVILHPGCVIGADGFGLAWENEHWLKVPQVGRVLLGDDVEVGANTTIDRGALDDTVIEDGVKLDNLIQIAHNCRIGRHTAIAGCAGIAGSARIGAYCQIGGAAMIVGHLEICDRVIISGGSLVAKDIREPGIYTSVQPLLPHREWLRNAVHLRHLDAMSQRIRKLESLIKKETQDIDSGKE
jgi:UDP-3-O-[3-hydroxymyristoyl] glucosamine N-acyltransferase